MRSNVEDRPRRPLLRRSLGGLAALLLVVTGGIVWLVLKDHPAETAVKDFFEALRDGDAESALALVDPNVAEGSLLTSEAVDMPWQVSETEVRETGSDSATVTATVDTGDGTEHVAYELERIDGDWLLDSPFIWVTFAWLAVDYGQANGAITTFEHQVVEGATNPGLTFALFPGEYEFYQSVPDVIAIESDGPRTLLEPVGGEHAVEIGAPPGTAFEPEAVAEVQHAVDGQMAECLESDEQFSENCPFWLDSPQYNADGEELTNFENLEWAIDEPFTVALGEYESGYFFPIVTEPEDSTVTVTGTSINRDADWTVEDFTARCPIDFTDWQASLTSDGERIGLDLNVIESASNNSSTCSGEL